MLVRLWYFTERVGGYPEGGTYDTSVFDDTSGNCSDPQQYIKFQDMMEAANARGEVLMEVETPEEAYAICSQNRLNTSPTTCGGGYVPNESTMYGAITRPAPSGCGIPTGGGSRNTPPNCPPPEPVVPPEEFAQPTVFTQMDMARRVIRLARLNPIVPTIVY